MKYLYVYHTKLTSGVIASTPNIQILPAKAQTMKIVQIGCYADNYAAARTFDAYLVLNNAIGTMFSYVFQKDLDSEVYIYPQQHDLGSFAKMDIRDVIFTSIDMFQLSANSIDANKYCELMVRAELSIYAKPTVNVTLSNSTATLRNNEIIGVIE
jgi:hypothetical protein